jgi:hypothetical protein
MLYYVLALHALRHVGSMLEALHALDRQSLVCTPDTDLLQGTPSTDPHTQYGRDRHKEAECARPMLVGRVTGARETMTAAREKRCKTRRERDEEGCARATCEGGPVVAQ